MEKEVLSITVRDHFGLPFVLLLVAIISTEMFLNGKQFDVNT